MDANDFFMIQHLSEVSQLLKTPDLDQMIRDLLKEEGVKHSPPVRAKTITKDGSRHPKSTPTKLGQSMAVESCSRGAVPDVDKVHCGAKHVTTLGKPCTFTFRFNNVLLYLQALTIMISRSDKCLCVFPLSRSPLDAGGI